MIWINLYLYSISVCFVFFILKPLFCKTVIAVHNFWYNPFYLCYFEYDIEYNSIYDNIADNLIRADTWGIILKTWSFLIQN